MERVTISLDDALAAGFERWMAERGYDNRSEAVRDLIRAELERSRQDAAREGQHAVACLSYVYNHHARELGERLTGHQHAHHDLTLATTHVHLDHDHCLEAVILRGDAARVRRFADSLRAERGVHHGQLNLISVERHRHGPADPHAHPHGGDDGHDDHLHLRPAG